MVTKNKETHFNEVFHIFFEGQQSSESNVMFTFGSSTTKLWGSWYNACSLGWGVLPEKVGGDVRPAP